MRLLRRLVGRGRATLVTCIVQRESGSWRVGWASEGRTPPDFSGEELAAVVETAAAKVASMYAEQPEAELQHVIYPWTGTSARIILDIEREDDGFLAKDMQGSGTLVRGESLETLVQEAERVLSDPHQAMFRWIRPVSDL